MKAVEGEEARLLREIEALQNQLIGVRRSIALLNGDDPERVAATTRKARSPIKDAVLGLIGEFKETGLSVNEVIELAQKRGQDLDRGSVSSLLSRLKREKVLDLQGSKYLPTQSEPPISPNPSEGGTPKLNIVR